MDETHRNAPPLVGVIARESGYPVRCGLAADRRRPGIPDRPLSRTTTGGGGLSMPSQLTQKQPRPSQAVD